MTNTQALLWYRLATIAICLATWLGLDVAHVVDGSLHGVLSLILGTAAGYHSHAVVHYHGAAGDEPPEGSA